MAWFHGDLIKSAEHGKLAVDICMEIGWPVSAILCLVELAITLFDAGRFDESEARLSQAFELCQGMNGLTFLAAINGARFALARGRKSQGLDLLAQGLRLVARYGYLNLPRWNNDSMSILCVEALEHGIEPNYVAVLIVRRGLTPVRYMENWPYPIKIFTLGGFRLQKDDRPVQTSGKVQRKPLELLKVVIALGWGQGCRR